MSNYTKSTNFATKDNLTPGDPLKVVRGTEIDTEFNNISTAIATKTDNSAAAITGGAIDGATVGATTPATGAFTTLAASGTTTLAGALVGAATQSAFNTVSTTLNLGGAATALNLGAATGTATVNNTTLAAKAITASTTLAVTGTSTLTGAVTATAGVSGPITSSSVSITGGSITGITDLAVADGGTGASTAADGLNNLLPSQTGNASKYLQTDGTNASWDAVSLSTADITGTLGAANGGTGVSNNAAMTVTGSGNFAYTRTLTGTTNVTFPTTGTLATLAGTETLTNKTLTSPTLTTPTLGVATGTSFQGIIGNVTPAAGSFTTLGASSTATLNTLSSSGATLTGGTINGMTVGATTATTGAFTTLTTSSTVTHNGGTANGVTYLNGSKVLTSGSALTFDGTIFQVSTAGGVQSRIATTGSQAGFQAFTSAGTFAVGATDYTSNATIHYVGNGTSGASEVMRLTSTSLYTASGINVGIGTSSPVSKLHIESASSESLQIGYSSTKRSRIGTTSAGDMQIYAFETAVGYHDIRIGYDGATAAGNVLIGGNLGIGTTSPASLLDVSSTGLVVSTVRTTSTTGVRDAKLRLNVASTGGDDPAGQIEFTYGTGYTVAGSIQMTHTSPNMKFFTGTTERARIDANGFFKARANGGAYFGGSNNQILNNNNVSGDVCLLIGNSAGNATNNTSSYSLIATDNGGDRLYIYGNGNVVNINNSYGALSDVKLKENIVDATPKLASLMQVKVRNYNLIGETTKQIGVVAQELETVFPAMIDESPDRDREGNDLGTTTKSVKYSVFVPMLIKAMQEQQAIIESLKARLDAANL